MDSLRHIDDGVSVGRTGSNRLTRSQISTYRWYKLRGHAMPGVHRSSEVYLADGVGCLSALSIASVAIFTLLVRSSVDRGV